VKNIGLYGGSFDPIHKAHLALARTARDTLALDEVQLIPAHNPWQRASLLATAQERAEMIALALDGEPGLRLNCSELERDGPTYTVDTVLALPDGARYFWLLGGDQLANFCTWREWQSIVGRVELAVACRPGSPLEAPAPLSDCLHALGRKLTVVPFAPTPVSGSGIRERLAQGRAVDDLVPAVVCRYIAQRGLYQN
jgi:nicotinate-nucleotide adenylyltransferase